MTDDLKPRSMKIGEDRWRRWQAQARATGVSLTALIVARMDEPPAGLSENDNPDQGSQQILAAAEIDDLRRTERQLRDLLAKAGDERQLWFERTEKAEAEVATQAKEIDRLGKVVVSQQMILAKIPPDEVLNELKAEIASLKKQLAAPLDKLRADIARIPPRKGEKIGGTLMGNPVMADPVPPVVGEASGYRPKASWKGKS